MGHWAYHGYGTTIQGMYFWVVIVDTVSYLVHCEISLQIIIDIITKCNTYFISKRNEYCKMRQDFY